MALRFDNRVAIVTGAGGGLGRTYALELAKRGCKVVVNDLGGDRHGSSSSTSMADKVVAEIKAAGGTAVANYDSVEAGEKIVKTAIDTYGRIDIVINNAGILRDVSFVNMKELDWDLIFRVHVKGAYSVTKAAWPYMRDQKYGRILVTSSNAAVYGNFGQVNYSAAKHALIGFAKSLAHEGAKYNIFSNAIIPTAGSRLTQTVMPEFMLEAFKPEYVTPLVVYASHENFPETGKLLEAGGGWYGELQYYRSNGKLLLGASAETLRDQWTGITNMDGARHIAKIGDQTAELMEMLSNARPESGSSSSGGASSDDFPSNIQSSALFKEIQEGIKSDPSVVAKIKNIFVYVITDSAGKELGKFTLDFKSSPPSVYIGDTTGAAAVTVTVSDQTFMDLAAGKENPQKAFMAGKIKAKGNIMLLQKLQSVLDTKKKAKI